MSISSKNKTLQISKKLFYSLEAKILQEKEFR